MVQFFAALILAFCIYKGLQMQGMSRKVSLLSAIITFGISLITTLNSQAGIP